MCVYAVYQPIKLLASLTGLACLLAFSLACEQTPEGPHRETVVTACLQFALTHACRDLSLVQFLVSCVDPAAGADVSISTSSPNVSRWLRLPASCQRLLAMHSQVLLRTLPSTRFVHIVDVLASRADKASQWQLLTALLTGLTPCVRSDGCDGVVLEVRTVPGFG
jgi:hypothetical protein